MKPFDLEKYPPVDPTEAVEHAAGPDPDPADDGLLAEGGDTVDLLGEHAGITYKEDEFLRFGSKEADRDLHRWELDPASAEDYRERMRHALEPDQPAEPLLHMTHRGGRPRRHDESDH